MADIFIEYKGRGIKEKKIKTITTDNINSVLAEFKFDSDWELYETKVAIFTVNECVAFKSYLDEHNQCIVPWEALRRPCEITVSVVGFHEEKTYTSVLVPVKIHQGGDVDAESPSEPTMNIIAQIEFLKKQIKELEKELDDTQKEIDEVEDLVKPNEDGINTIYLDGGLI